MHECTIGVAAIARASSSGVVATVRDRILSFHGSSTFTFTTETGNKYETVAATQDAFAAVVDGGTAVHTWGDSDDNGHVGDAGNTHATVDYDFSSDPCIQLVASKYAFSCLTSNQYVVSWGTEDKICDIDTSGFHGDPPQVEVASNSDECHTLQMRANCLASTNGTCMWRGDQNVSPTAPNTRFEPQCTDLEVDATPSGDIDKPKFRIATQEGEPYLEGSFFISSTNTGQQEEYGEKLCEYGIITKAAAHHHPAQCGGTQCHIYDAASCDSTKGCQWDGTNGCAMDPNYCFNQQAQEKFSVSHFGIFYRIGMSVNQVAGKAPNRLPMFTMSFVSKTKNIDSRTSTTYSATPLESTFTITFRDDDTTSIDNARAQETALIIKMYDAGTRSTTAADLTAASSDGSTPRASDADNTPTVPPGPTRDQGATYCYIDSLKLYSTQAGTLTTPKTAPSASDKLLWDVPANNAGWKSEYASISCKMDARSTTSGSLGSAIDDGDVCRLEGEIKCNNGASSPAAKVEVEVEWQLVDITERYKGIVEDGDVRYTLITLGAPGSPYSHVYGGRRLTSAQPPAAAPLSRRRTTESAGASQGKRASPLGLDVGVNNGFLKASMAGGQRLATPPGLVLDGRPQSVGGAAADDGTALQDFGDDAVGAVGAGGSSGTGGLQSNQRVVLNTGGGGTDGASLAVPIVAGLAGATIMVLLVMIIVSVRNRQSPVSRGQQSVVYPVVPTVPQDFAPGMMAAGDKVQKVARSM